MIYVLCMLAGAAVFMGGFFVGRSVTTKEPASPLVAPQMQADIEAASELQKQIANMYSYNGRPQG